eukprot:jgi/Botrbrau1/8023/Bobra.13_2s0003.1
MGIVISTRRRDGRAERLAKREPKLVTREGLAEYLRQKIINLADPKNNPMETSGPLFMTLDGRVRFKVVVSWSSTPRPASYPVHLDLVCGSFPWDKDVRVILHTHLVQLTISLWWPDDDDFMMTIPDYAREFESERDPQDSNVLYRISLKGSDVNREELDTLHTEVVKLQHLRECGCGQPYIGTAALCPACTIQATPQDMQEETCIICQDTILHKWNRKQPCCSAWMHRHCALELAPEAPCPHCRRGPKRARPYEGPTGREQVDIDDDCTTDC